MVGPGTGEGDRESVFHGVRVSVWEGEKVLETMEGWLHDKVNVLNAIKLCTQKLLK